MKHPYDQINHEFILGLRAGHDADTSATIAHFTRGNDRKYHIDQALKAADKVTAAAAKLRADIDAIEAAQVSS